MSASKTVRTMCPMNCHPTLCGMLVTVADDGGISIEGDPENPDSRGFLCGRGRAAGEIIGNPLRLLTAQVRDERGSDAWRTVAWEQAVDRLADTLRGIAPEEFGIWLGHGELATNYGIRVGGQLSKRFSHLYGAQWWHPAMICWGLGGFGLGLTGLLEVNTKEDMSAHSDLIIMWGANIASQPNTAPHIKAARARGARLFTIDVRDAEASARADLALRIRPGTDAALALGMMNVIIGEGLTDEAFIAAHTEGFEQLREHVRPYTPRWTAEQTGLAPEQIETLAREYAGTRRAIIVLGGSSMHKHQHGWQGARAIACLPALTGKLGIHGGGLGERHGGITHGQALNGIVPDTPSACRTVIPDQMEAMTRAFEDGRIKVLLLVGTNMLSSFADSNALARALEKVELIVCVDLFSNETIREHADIVLPATAWLEQVGGKMTHSHLYLMEQALEAPPEARTFTALLRALAERLGMDDFFPWTDEEALIDAFIDHPATGNATVAGLREAGGIRALNVSLHAYPDHRYATPSGKVEFFSKRAASLGLPALPEYTPLESSPGALVFRQGRTLNHFHAFYDHGQALPTLARRGGVPTLWIAPADATTRGIENGAAIRIFNERGEFEATAHVTPKIDSGCVWMRDGWGGINRLTSGKACIPDEATNVFAFAAGQAAFDANVQVEPLPRA